MASHATITRISPLLDGPRRQTTSTPSLLQQNEAVNGNVAMSSVHNQQEPAGGPRSRPAVPPSLDERTCGLPPALPARLGPGAAVRVLMSPSLSSPAAPAPPQRAPTSSPQAVPRVPAPSLPARNAVVAFPSVVGLNGGVGARVSSGSSGSSSPPPTPSLIVAAVVSSSPVTGDSEVITLTQPRPDGERTRNEYIDTPLKGGMGRAGGLLSVSSMPLHAETHIHISGAPHDHLALVSPLGTGSQLHKTSPKSSSKSLPFHLAESSCTLTTSPSLKRLHSTRRSLPITKQPVASVGIAPFTKDSLSTSSRNGQADSTRLVSNVCTSSSKQQQQASQQQVSISLSSSSSSSSSNSNDSIICPECSRCRCESCRTPRALPSKWLCGDKCLCSAESCVDYASCLCCVKGIFYHFGSSSDDEDEDIDDTHDMDAHHRHPHRLASGRANGRGSCVDAPCSCAPNHHRLARWGCLASLSFILPCLLCYWPLQGGVKVAEFCYQRCTRHGCRCNNQQSNQQRKSGSMASQIHHRQPDSMAASLEQGFNTPSSKTTIISQQPLVAKGF